YGRIGTVLVATAPYALLWPAAMIVWGPGYTSSKHRHHCVQLVMALEGKLRVRSGAGRRWKACGAVLIRPDAPHEVDATDTRVLLAFVDSESDLGAALLDGITSEIAMVPDATVDGWRLHLGDPATLTGIRVKAWVSEHLLSKRRMPRIHPAVRRVLRVVRNEIASKHEFSLERLAEVANLSPSRL